MVINITDLQRHAMTAHTRSELDRCLYTCQNNLELISKSWWDYIIYYQLRRELIKLIETIEQARMSVPVW